MYQTMSGGIDLYGQEVAALKKMGMLATDLADRLDLPEDALLGAAKLTVTGGRKALIENHRGVLEYGTERILVSAGRENILLEGSGLQLEAMNRSELLVTGKLQRVEWE